MTQQKRMFHLGLGFWLLWHDNFNLKHFFKMQRQTTSNDHNFTTEEANFTLANSSYHDCLKHSIDIQWVPLVLRLFQFLRNVFSFTSPTSSNWCWCLVLIACSALMNMLCFLEYIWPQVVQIHSGLAKAFRFLATDLLQTPIPNSQGKNAFTRVETSALHNISHPFTTHVTTHVTTIWLPKTVWQFERSVQNCRRCKFTVFALGLPLDSQAWRVCVHFHWCKLWRGL